MSFLYFAYGSNMLSGRLLARCSSAKVFGIATARHHELQFSKRSKDGSGKATLLKSKTAIRTPGVLFEISSDDLDALDRFEGVGNGYDRFDDFNVEMAGGYQIATTYIAAKPEHGLSAFDWYLALVIAGAIEHKLDITHVNFLRAIPYESDKTASRASRVAALKVLANHGYKNYAVLFQE